MYDISNCNSASISLKRILQISNIKQEWYRNELNADRLIKKFTKQIQEWDLTKEEFLVRHITSSVDCLEDIKKMGLLYLPDVLTKDTTLKKMLNENDIYFDIQNEMLTVCGQHFDLNQTRRGRNDAVLFQIHRAIYDDYLSTILYMEKPWHYGTEIYKHPEFMMYLESINAKCKEFVDWWGENSKGYMITAKVPFKDVCFETFGFEAREKESFLHDSKHNYRKSKEYLTYCALSVLFSFSSDVCLYIDKNKSIKPEQFIKIEEKDRD